MKKNYAERDIMEMDNVGGYYIRHVSAMTAEELHSKSDIAAELGHRDMVIDELQEVLQEVTRSIEITIRVGYERIIELGGECDSVDAMIKGHSEIARARAAIKKALGEDE